MSDERPEPADLRIDPRKAMFVAAELMVGSAVIPIKIRNMSSRGALVEAASLPPEKTAVRLKRGPLSIAGTVSWASGGRGGIALDGAVAVEDWIRGKLPDHQVRVDALIEEIRKTGREPESIAAAALQPTLERSQVDVETELRALAALIGGLEDGLIDDPHIIARHGDALQKIDEAQQRIAALVKRLAAKAEGDPR